MKQEVYDIIVIRTASKVALDSNSDNGFEPAVAAIQQHLAAHGDAVIAHLGNNDLPLRTARKLGTMTGRMTLHKWSYWGSNLEFAKRVAEVCPKNQLFVLVGHEPTVDRVLQMTNAPIGIPETPRLIPFTLRLTVTRRVFRQPAYELAFVA